MELRQLTYFIAISDAKSFTRAAERLFISQPALTGQINSLEAELGVRLFERTNKSVALTPAGKVFYKHASQVLSEVNKTLFQMEKTRKSEGETLFFAVHPFFSGNLFFAFFESIRQLLDNCNLHYDFVDWDDFESSKNRRRYSFGIMPDIAGNSRDRIILAKSQFVFSAQDMSSFSHSDPRFIIPKAARLREAMTELLPANSYYSTFIGTDDIIRHMCVENAILLLPRAIVPKDTVICEVGKSLSMSVVLVGTDENVAARVSAPLSDRLLHLGWESTEP